MSIYDKIIDLCKGNGVPVTVLEKELGFSRGSIGKMKTAKRSPYLRAKAREKPLGTGFSLLRYWKKITRC